MALRKSAAGSGLQVLLERNGTVSVGEFNSDVDTPWCAASCVSAAPVVVSPESCADVGRQPGVVTGRRGVVLQDIDEPFGRGHAAGQKQRDRQPE